VMAVGVECVVAAAIAAFANNADDGRSGAVGGTMATNINAMHSPCATAAISAGGKQ